MYCRQCGARLEDGLYYCPSCGAEQGSEAPSAAASTTAAPVRCVWPEWEMGDTPIGRGSFGTVYKAVRRDYDVESYAAIKVISIPSDPAEVESLRADGMDENASRTYLEGVVRDFIGEVRVMESLKGAPNIVSVEDYKVVEKQGEIGWDIYIRMELLTPFAQHSAGRTVTEAEVIRLGVDICTALELCGRRSIIHRDIKPENIFIDRFGQFKLGDFGIARKLENMTGGLSQKGTFNYMAPEVASGRTYDARVDIYSLGIVLYRLLNGNRLPFLSTDRQLLNPNDRRMALERRLSGQPLPVPCDASPAMAEVILRACAYDPNDRFASALEMKQALLRAAGGERTPTPAPVDDRTIRVRHPEQGGEAPAADERLYPRPRTPREETASVYRPFGGGGDTVGIRTGIGGTETVDARPDQPEAEHKTAFCARCGAQVPIQQRFCPQCGLEQPVPAPESMPPKMQPTSGGKTRWWLIAACAVAVVALIIGAVLLWPSAETSRATETAKATETIKDDVYVCVRETFYYPDGTVSWFEYDYDENGNTLTRAYYDADGDIDWSCEFTYDKNGNALTRTYYNAEGDVDWWCELTYDENGNALTEVDYSADGSIDTRAEFTYDKKGNMLKEAYYNADGSSDGWYEFTYDEKGNMLKQTDYDADGEITGWIKSTYDEDGNEIEWIAYDADGSFEFRYEYSYDENGNKAEEYGYDGDGHWFSRTEYEYMTLAEWNASAQPDLPTPKATTAPKAAESVPVVDSAPVDEKLENYKEYVAAYAVAMALDDNEKAAVQEAIDACTTADRVENCQYLTSMYWNGIILYYPEWVEAGCPVADVGSYNATAFSTMNGFSAVTDGVECWDDGSIIATCTYTKPNTETEQYSYSITFGLSAADVVIDFAGHIGDSFSGAMDSYSVEQSLEWFQVFVPGVTYYYRAEIRESSSYWDGEVIAAGDIKSFTVPQREIESIELGQSKTVEGWGDAEFSFTPATGGEYTVELSADGAVDVFNSAGEMMAGNYPTFNTHSGKTYYIRITNYSGSSQVITLTK